MTSPNFDLALEQAMACEAIHDWARYTAYGLDANDFESPSCRLVVEAAHVAWEADGASGQSAVLVALGRMGKLEAIGGRQGLSTLVADSGVPDIARFRELAALRRLEALLAKAATHARHGDITAALETASGAAASVASGDTTVRTASELIESVLTGVIAEAGGVLRIHPGLEKLAEAIGSLPVGSVTVIAGNTSVGKSSYTLEMLLACAHRGVGAGLISLEDPEEVTGSRLIATVSGVSSSRIQRRAFGEGDFPAMMRTVPAMAELGEKLLFADCMGGNELDVCAAMSRMAARGAKVVAVDYIGELESSKPQQDRRNEIRWLLKRLKSHAKRLGVALVVVSQLARPKDKNPNAEPTKHDLKEAGDLENSAEVVILLWRDIEHDFAPVNVKIGKSKIGGTGARWLMQREMRDKSGRLSSGRLVEVDQPERSWYEHKG